MVYGLAPLTRTSLINRLDGGVVPRGGHDPTRSGRLPNRWRRRFAVIGPVSDNSRLCHRNSPFIRTIGDVYCVPNSGGN